MTPEEHAKELKRLERLRDAKRTLSKSPGKTLAEKLAIMEEVKALNIQIDEHQLNYHRLVPPQGIEVLQDAVIAHLRFEGKI